MGGDEGASEPGTNPAEQITSQRAALVDLLEELPETRLSKPTPRAGWTLRHELSWLAASDEELLRRLDPAHDAGSDDAAWRRLRGQAMHTAQELRLAALREHLEASGARVAASLESNASRLAERTIRAAVDAHLEHAAAALTSLHRVLSK